MTEEPEKIEGEVKEEQEQKDEKWDKTRQELDQNKANVEKLSEHNTELQEQVGELQTTIEQERQETADKLANIEKQLADKAKEEKIDDIENIDPDLVDPNVIKVLKGLKVQQESLEKQIAEKDADIAKLQEAKEKYETDREKSIDDARKTELKEAMLTELDKEFGSKFRNDAVALANKKVKESGKAPEGDFFIYKFIRDCYKEITTNAPKETPVKETVPSDSGASGVTFKEGEIKEGSIEEVLPQIAAKYKGKGFSMPKT